MDWVADANTDENGDTIGDVPQPILNLEDLDMHADEHGDLTENPPRPILNLENLAESATLGSIKISLDFIQELKTASLDNGHLAPEVVSRLKNPPSGSIDLIPDQRLSLELFVATHNSAQHVYVSVKDAIERRYPESKLLSLERVKQLTVEITGILPITDHMCPNSCIAYTGPFKALETCPVCGKRRFENRN